MSPLLPFTEFQHGQPMQYEDQAWLILSFHLDILLFASQITSTLHQQFKSASNGVRECIFFEGKKSSKIAMTSIWSSAMTDDSYTESVSRAVSRHMVREAPEQGRRDTRGHLIQPPWASHNRGQLRSVHHLPVPSYPFAIKIEDLEYMNDSHLNSFYLVRVAASLSK